MNVNDFKVFDNKEIYFEAFTAEAPETFPETSDDIEELPNGYDFRMGSYIYVVDEMTVYMWDGEEFVAQNGGE